MNLNKDKNQEVYLYAWYERGDPKHVKETGEYYTTAKVKLHYRIEVLKDIGLNTKSGILYGFNFHNEKWIPLYKANISNDTLYNDMRVNTNKPHFLYIKGYGVWRVDKLVVDKKSATIQITRFEEA